MQENLKIKKFLPVKIRQKLPKKILVKEIDEKTSRRLNLIYRQKNKSTNVLSFRYGEEYGEILVCPQVTTREAKRFKKPVFYQMTWMILHGMIHLAGIHHEKSEKQTKLFEQIEKEALRKLF